MSSRPKYNIGEEGEEASVRWTEFARIHSNYSSGTRGGGISGVGKRKGKKKDKEGGRRGEYVTRRIIRRWPIACMD